MSATDKHCRIRGVEMARPIRHMDESPTQAVEQHRWRMLAAGRICDDCLEVQVKSEFDDTTPCPGGPLSGGQAHFTDGSAPHPEHGAKKLMRQGELIRARP